MEVVLTLGLVSVILGTASGAQNIGIIGALGVGAYIALAGLWGSPISGASMNPARTFGPDLVGGDFAHYWVYVAGPLAGAVIAVGAAWILRGAAAEGPAPGQRRARSSPKPRTPATLEPVMTSTRARGAARPAERTSRASPPLRRPRRRALPSRDTARS